MFLWKNFWSRHLTSGLLGVKLKRYPCVMHKPPPPAPAPRKPTLALLLKRAQTRKSLFELADYQILMEINKPATFLIYKKSFIKSFFKYTHIFSLLHECGKSSNPWLLILTCIWLKDNRGSKASFESVFLNLVEVSDYWTKGIVQVPLVWLQAFRNIFLRKFEVAEVNRQLTAQMVDRWKLNSWPNPSNTMKIAWGAWCNG